MDAFASRPASSSRAESTLISKVPVIGVVIAAAIALGAASVMSGYPMGGPALFASLAAVAGGVVWLYAPRIGYWVLLVDGVVTTALSGVALARGAVPWLLVAFWGGSALLLAAILHLTASPGRSNTVTLVAVISLLALSALGLGQYVRTTWTADERAILERLPRMVAARSATPAWVAEPEPAPEGAWTCSWAMAVTRSEALRTTRSVLVRNGWRIRTFSTVEIVAVKSGERLDVLLANGPEVESRRPEGIVFVATVADAEPVGAP